MGVLEQERQTKPAARTDGQPHGNGEERHDEHAPEHGIPTDLPKISGLVIAVIVVVIIVFFGALFMVGWLPHEKRQSELNQEADEARQAKPVVEVAALKREPAAIHLELPGGTEAMQTTAIYPRANGYLKKLYVDIGDHVKAGQLLAEIDSPEVDAELEQAKATLQQANVTVGRAKNEYEFNKSTFERYSGFFKTGGVTQQQLDERRAAFNIATSSLAAAEASLAAAKADVQKYTDMQGFERVIAPFDGTITARGYDVGALLSATNTTTGKELFRIDQINVLRVFVNVPQTYVSDVKVGMMADLFVRNYPGRPFKGSVVRSTGALDATTRTLRYEVDFPNEPHELLPGMYGMVKFALKQDRPLLLVPTSAFLFEADGLKVATVADGKVHYHKISVGRDFGPEAEVLSGLSGDEQIVTNPGERLQEGLDVQVRAAKDKVATTATSPKAIEASTH